MIRLLKLTAIIEAATGLALIALPAIVVRLLLGAEISGASIPVGRVAGAALLALGVACWLVQYDAGTCAARALVSAMASYNLGVTLILGAAGIGSHMIGIALWARGHSPRRDGCLVRHQPSEKANTCQLTQEIERNKNLERTEVIAI